MGGGSMMINLPKLYITQVNPFTAKTLHDLSLYKWLHKWMSATDWQQWVTTLRHNGYFKNIPIQHQPTNYLKWVCLGRNRTRCSTFIAIKANAPAKLKSLLNYQGIDALEVCNDHYQAIGQLIGLAQMGFPYTDKKEKITPITPFTDIVQDLKANTLPRVKNPRTNTRAYHQLLLAIHMICIHEDSQLWLQQTGQPIDYNFSPTWLKKGTYQPYTVTLEYNAKHALNNTQLTLDYAA